MSNDKKVKGAVEQEYHFDGTKNISTHTVFCTYDGCTECERISRVVAQRLPDDLLRKKFQLRGWVFRHGEWFCPTHGRRTSRLREVEIEEATSRISPNPQDLVPPVPSVQNLIPPEYPHALASAPEPPKESLPMNSNIPLKSFGDLASSIARMTQSDRRRIFRNIDENWDDGRGRYLGSESDGSIAKKLDVPRAWVEHIRKEAFGDTADNEEIEQLREELDAALKKAAADTDDALRIAARMEANHNAIRKLEERLAKVEAAVGVRR